MEFVYQRTIWAHECDIYGHLNNSRYLNVYEEARAMALTQMGVPVRAFLEAEIDLYVIRAEIDFTGSIQFERNLTVKSRIVYLDRVVSWWHQEMYDQEEKLINRVKIKAAFARRGKAQRLPLDLMAKLQPFITPESSVNKLS